MTVNAEFDSNMFFWYFPAAYQPHQAPVVLWLQVRSPLPSIPHLSPVTPVPTPQGGPGGSSLFGLFVEHGPFAVTEELGLEERSTAWSLTHHMIYIDNPVGK